MPPGPPCPIAWGAIGAGARVGMRCWFIIHGGTEAELAGFAACGITIGACVGIWTAFFNSVDHLIFQNFSETFGNFWKFFIEATVFPCMFIIGLFKCGESANIVCGRSDVDSGF